MSTARDEQVDLRYGQHLREVVDHVRALPESEQRWAATHRRKPLTEEMVRILKAVSEGRMTTNQAGRWVIAGEARPKRSARETLTKRGYIEWRIRLGTHAESGYATTVLGESYLAAL